jgi:uncharacterized repeat protein (TIGR01451 family)
MKRSFVLGLSLASLTTTALLAGVAYAAAGPGAKASATAGSGVGTPTPASARKEQPVRLLLSAEKKAVEMDATGKQIVVWQPVSDKTQVQPADVVRYTVVARNSGERPVTGLAITQPVPLGTRYLLESAQAATDHRPQMTYSIDNGRSFTPAPTIKVTLPNGKVETRPAPAEMYTHVRWMLTRALDPATPAKVSYLARVK